jgi:hypothetical protein
MNQPSAVKQDFENIKKKITGKKQGIYFIEAMLYARKFSLFKYWKKELKADLYGLRDMVYKKY